MVVIPSGSFMMGSNHNRPDERPQHKVTIGRAFANGAYEITNSEWDACVREAACRYSPRRAEEGRLPIGNVSWDDAEQYVHWLSGKAGGHYRLPTEAEWEYAARAGTRTTYWWGDAKGSGRANCSNCATSWDGKGKSPVGSFSPNPFGLYDMNGNLWEWTADCWNRSYNGAPTDGSAWIHGQCLSRVLRGGCWNLGADYMRSARRGTYDRDVRYYLNGFRVAKDLD
jgi:formylglycine-generating enzyme required for sulfatase activity